MCSIAATTPSRSSTPETTRSTACTPFQNQNGQWVTCHQTIQLPTGSGPIYAEYAPATQQLVVANYEGGTISVIDVPLDEYGNDSNTYTNNNCTTYASCGAITGGFGTVHTITVGNTATPNPASVTVLYDGTKAYTANQNDGAQNGTVTVVNLSTYTVEKTITVVGHPRTVVNTQNSEYAKIYVASPDSPYITIIESSPTVTDADRHHGSGGGHGGGCAHHLAERQQRQQQLQQPRAGLRPAVQPVAFEHGRHLRCELSLAAMPGHSVDRAIAQSLQSKGPFPLRERPFDFLRECATAMPNADETPTAKRGQKHGSISCSSSGALLASRERARALILAGRVLVREQKIDKPGTAFAQDSPIRLLGEDQPYVSRGGLKLAAALEHWQIDVKGRACLDVGASTGGFTDCLLQHGAAQVTAVDTGFGQIAHEAAQRPARAACWSAPTRACSSRARWPPATRPAPANSPCWSWMFRSSRPRFFSGR